MRKLLLALVLCGLSMGFSPQQTALLGGIPNWVPNRQNPPDIAINWQQNIAWKKKGGLTSISALGVTITRASAETNLLSTSPSGFAYTSVPSGVIASGPAFGGRQTWEARTNFLLNSAVPATQTTGSLANGTYTLWVNGSGTATMSSGTATGCGTSAASQGTPISFTTSGTAGTCTVTVGGSLNFFQLELNPGSVSAPSPGIVTAGATVTRAADVIKVLVTGGSAFTLFEQMIPQVPTTYATLQGLLELNDGTVSNRSSLRRNNATALPVISFNGGTGGTVSAPGSPVWAINTPGILTSSASAGAQAISFNNGTVGTGAIATLPNAPTTLEFGSVGFGTSGWCNCTAIIDAVWLTQAIPNSQVQSAL